MARSGEESSTDQVRARRDRVDKGGGPSPVRVGPRGSPAARAGMGHGASAVVDASRGRRLFGRGHPMRLAALFVAVSLAACGSSPGSGGGSSCGADGGSASGTSGGTGGSNGIDGPAQGPDGGPASTCTSSSDCARDVCGAFCPELGPDTPVCVRGGSLGVEGTCQCQHSLAAAGDACAANCWCQSGACAGDPTDTALGASAGICCPSKGTGASGTACQSSCECASTVCQSSHDCL